MSSDIDDCLDAGIRDVNAHSVARDFGDIFVCRCDFVSAVARTDEVGEVFDVAFKFGHLSHDFVHGRFRRESGVDFALYGCVCEDFAVLVHDDCFGVG